MGEKKRFLGIIFLALIIGIFGGYGLSQAYTLSISMEDNQGGSLNMSYDIDTPNPGSDMISMTAECCFSTYHPSLEGTIIDGCLNMTYHCDSSGTNFTLTVHGGPVTYTFLDGGAFQVYYDNFTIVFSGTTFAISGTVYIDDVPYDLSGWNSNPMCLFF